MVNEKTEPVQFKNKKGLLLFGMLHTPVENSLGKAILLLSPGEKNRVAPHRLYVKMASVFCSLGFHVLRFDPEGLGDSEGEVDYCLSADLYGSIQVGRFVQDTVAAMDWLEENLSINQFILSGLCGGAITGLHTGAMDGRVIGLHGLGIPVALDSSNVDSAAFITQGQLEQIKRGYISKVLKISSWYRLLTFRTDYRLLLKSFFRSKKQAGEPGVDKPPADVNDNFNPFFAESFEKMVTSGKKLELIFSESDRLYAEFQEKFLPRTKQSLLDEKYVSVHVVPEANHIFTFGEWQDTMMDLSAKWLQENFIH